MPDEKTTRDSKIELLRVIAMFMIVLNHSVSHGVFEGRVLESSEVSWQICSSYFFSIFGIIGNGVFMILTGYFCVKKENESIDFNAISRVSIKMTFYSLIIFIILSLTKMYSFTFSEIITAFFPYLFGLNWYFCCYIVIMLFAPALVKMIVSLEEKQLNQAIGIGFFLKFILPMFKISTYMPYASDFYQFVFMFFVGGAVYKAISSKRYRVSLVPISTFLGVLLSFWLILSFCIPYISKAMNSEQILSYYNTYIRNAIATGISVTSVLLCVGAMSFYNKIINVLARSTPAVYLIHDNRFFRTILWQNNYDMIGSNFFIFYLLLLCCAVFVFSILIDCLVHFCFKNVAKNMIKQLSALLESVFSFACYLTRQIVGVIIKK